METNTPIRIAIADDQQLFLRSLAALIGNFDNFSVTIEALNGQELLTRIAATSEKPELVLIDVRMPVMSGSEAVVQLTRQYPQLKTIALSMNDDDDSVIAMLKAGCCAYLLKDINPAELQTALTAVYEQGYYNADSINRNLRRIIAGGQANSISLSEREKAFLQLACSDMTYREIASRMCLSEKTVDGYRESIFIKLNVKSRVGMALEAIRHNLVAL